MKNKKLLFILIPLAVLIWMVIFYKISGYQNGSFQVQSEYSLPDTAIKSELITPAIAFTGKYRDPFLKKSNNTNDYPVMERQNKFKNELLKETSSVKNIPAINWPKINYKGAIVNHPSNKKLAILTINMNNYLLNENQEIEACKLLEIYDDSVKFRFGNEIKTFQK